MMKTDPLFYRLDISDFENLGTIEDIDIILRMNQQLIQKTQIILLGRR